MATRGENEFLTSEKNIGGTKISFVNYNYSIAGSAEKALAKIRGC